MSTRTPGPWKLGKWDDVLGCAQILGPDGKEVLVADFTTEANARLIAAAPDLLEAAENAYWVLRDSRRAPNAAEVATEREGAMRALRAAIAQAEGGQA